MVGRRRLSETLSEGDGISVLVHVATPDDASTAAGQGAQGLSSSTIVPNLDDVDLPVLFRGESPESAEAAGADGWLLVAESFDGEGQAIEASYRRAGGLGLECVVDVRDEDELELVLEWIDPEIFLLSPREADEDEDPLDRVLALLPDVPAGKLAVAELSGASPDDVLALERAGVDAVLVSLADAAALAGSGHAGA